MNHTDIIRELQAMTLNTRKTIGNCDVKRDGTGDYWCAQTPRGYTAYYHASSMAAIILSWQTGADSAATEPAIANLATLTTAEDARWTYLFTTMIEGSGVSDDAADAAVWQVMVREFPRLAEFNGCLAEAALATEPAIVPPQSLPAKPAKPTRVQQAARRLGNL